MPYSWERNVNNNKKIKNETINVGAYLNSKHDIVHYNILISRRNLRFYFV